MAVIFPRAGERVRYIGNVRRFGARGVIVGKPYNGGVNVQFDGDDYVGWSHLDDLVLIPPTKGP